MDTYRGNELGPEADDEKNKPDEKAWQLGALTSFSFGKSPETTIDTPAEALADTPEPDEPTPFIVPRKTTRGGGSSTHGNASRPFSMLGGNKRTSERDPAQSLRAVLGANSSHSIEEETPAPRVFERDSPLPPLPNTERSVAERRSIKESSAAGGFLARMASKSPEARTATPVEAIQAELEKTKQLLADREANRNDDTVEEQTSETDDKLEHTAAVTPPETQATTDTPTESGPIPGLSEPLELARKVEQLSTPELLDAASSLFISGVSVRELYNTNQIDRQGLIKLVHEGMRGSDLGELYESLKLGRERQRERAREFRHDDPGFTPTHTPSPKPVIQPIGQTIMQDVYAVKKLYPPLHIPDSEVPEPIKKDTPPDVQHIAAKHATHALQKKKLVVITVVLSVACGIAIALALVFVL